MINKLLIPYVLLMGFFIAFALMPDLHAVQNSAVGSLWLQVTLLFLIFILAGYHLYIEVM